MIALQEILADDTGSVERPHCAVFVTMDGLATGVNFEAHALG